MRTEPSRGIPSFLGRRISAAISARMGRRVTEAVHGAKDAGEPVLRAFVDSFLADRIAGATWPAFLTMLSIVGLHEITYVHLSDEAIRIGVGAVVMAALGWSVYGTAIGVFAAFPHIRIWFVGGLPPTRHVRLLLFQWIRTQHRNLTDMTAADGFGADIVASAIARFQEDNRINAEETAFLLADHLAPVLVRHALRRMAVLVVPYALAFCYYRLAVYPDIVARYTTAGPWAISVYPVAALCDAMLGTHIREALRNQ